MATQNPQPTVQPKPTAPGKPASRQPPDANTGKERDGEEGQEIPKTGHDPSEAIEEDLSNSAPAEDDADDADEGDTDGDDDTDGGDGDDDEAGSIELPPEGGERDRLNGSTPDNQ